MVCAADRKVFNPSIAASTNRINLDQDGDSVNDYAFDAAGNKTVYFFNSSGMKPQTMKPSNFLKIGR